MSNSENTNLSTACCVTGGGPAGMMLGLLLARAGVTVTVLEKHADFLRDFRGDTLHPSTLQVMHELGLAEELLKRPHQEARHVSASVGDTQIPVADFTHLPVRHRFIAFMPQWDFLDFLADHARQWPTFRLLMQTQVNGLIEERGNVTGVCATTPQGPLEVRADLVVGADGRHSTVRAQAGLEVEDLGAPIDVLWMRISRRDSDPAQPFGRFDRGRVFVLIYRDDYWQCGYIIAKGGYEAIRQAGLEAFRRQVADAGPFLTDRVNELKSWDQVRLLTVTIDRLKRWYRVGLLCIGDAAHAMSPVGGVGINLAIQDAVAAANALADPLRERRVDINDLRRVQRRRALPTRLTQALQVAVQKSILVPGLTANPPATTIPWPLLLMRQWPALRRIPARVIGMGFRPEHVRVAERPVSSLARHAATDRQS